ncbi:hypothetical protein ACWPO1_04935 [Acinetobacter nosocomialis]
MITRFSLGRGKIKPTRCGLLYQILAYTREEIDTGQLLQLSSQLPAVTVSNEVLSDLDDLQRNFPISPTAQCEDIQPMPTASVFHFEADNIFPITNICCDDKPYPLPTVQITNDMQVIINGTN